MRRIKELDTAQNLGLRAEIDAIVAEIEGGSA